MQEGTLSAEQQAEPPNAAKVPSGARPRGLHEPVGFIGNSSAIYSLLGIVTEPHGAGVNSKIRSQNPRVQILLLLLVHLYS